MRALLVIDAQNDFMPGGSLAVKEGDLIVPGINKISPLFEIVVFTKDWHLPSNCGLEKNGGIWPDHCIQNTTGAELHKDLFVPAHSNIFKKGDQVKHPYSPFEEEDDSPSRLADFFKDKGVDTLYVCGLATDYCVKFGVVDAIKEGFEVYLLEDLCRGVNLKPDDSDMAMRQMRAVGAKIINSDTI